MKKKMSTTAAPPVTLISTPLPSRMPRSHSPPSHTGLADVFGVVRVDPHSGTRVLVSETDPVTGLTIGGGLRFGQGLAGIAVERDGHL
jgi:hypothetical protein